MAKFRRVLANLFIIAFLMVAFIDGFPSLGKLHDRARAWIDFVTDVTGLWQGPWSLFAGGGDRENHHVEVCIRYDDGSESAWRSPRWHALSPLGQFFVFREMELTEKLQRYPSLYPELVRYLAKELQPSPDVSYQGATVDYYYFDIWPPVEGDHQSYPERQEESHFYFKRLYEDPEP